MSDERLKRLGVAWWTSGRKALILNLYKLNAAELPANERLDPDARMVIFKQDLDDLFEGRYRGRSVPVYKSRELRQRRETKRDEN